MSFIKEFKEFAATGNLVDLASGVVMGAAVAKVVSAFIDGMVMPAIGMITGGVDFSKMGLTLKAAVAEDKAAGVKAAEAVVVKYGAFITVFIEFMIVALVVFMVLKAINKMKKAKAADAPAGPTPSEALLTEIRDALKK
jgi:large conductance mechanosensitive channel